MAKTKEKIATQHYHDLNRLFSQAKYLCMKEMLPPKDVFIREYPLSTIGIVSIRKFWEVCLELGIVKHPFFEDETKYSPFEKELYDLCCKYMYSDEEDCETEHFRKEAQSLFKKYELI